MKNKHITYIQKKNKWGCEVYSRRNKISGEVVQGTFTQVQDLDSRLWSDAVPVYDLTLSHNINVFKSLSDCMDYKRFAHRFVPMWLRSDTGSVRECLNVFLLGVSLLAMVITGLML